MLQKYYAERIKGLIGIAAAPDFTQDMYNTLTAQQKQQLQEGGYTFIPSIIEGSPYLITHDLIEDGKKNLVLHQPSIQITSPIVLLHGMEDNIVPYQQSLQVAKHLASDDVVVRLIKHGDHALNDKKALESLYGSIFSIVGK